MTKTLYAVEYGRNIWKEFDTYEQAELFCGVYGIDCHNIYEMTEEEEENGAC